MELKIVKRPHQDDNTMPKDIQYIGEKWCVKTHFYREKIGGLNKWYEWLEKHNPDIVYLYEIKLEEQEILNKDFVPEKEKVYVVRADYKNVS